MSGQITMDIVRLQYNASGEITTQQMLAVGYRLMTESRKPLHVQLVRLGENKQVRFDLQRLAIGGPVVESINVVESGG